MNVETGKSSNKKSEKRMFQSRLKTQVMKMVVTQKQKAE